MKMPMICAAILVALGMPAKADTQYDRKLERAVMEIVAAKMGALRAGFAYDAKPVFVVIQVTDTRDPVATGMMAAADTPTSHHGWSGGLVLAVERKTARVIAF